MKYVQIGSLKASAIGVGFWQFGSEQWGWGEDLGAPAAEPVVQRALAQGINLFDTAELYGHGRSEEILAASLAGRRDDVIIASKVTPTHTTKSGTIRAAHGSLARLRTSAIDLYQVHWPNRFIPVQRTMAGMRRLLDDGAIREVGVSNFPLSLWQRADRALGRPVASNQVEFHLLDLSPLDDLVPFVQREGRAIIAYSPLAQGLLGGRYTSSNLPTDFRGGLASFSRANFERVGSVLDEVAAVAERHGATPAQIALAWLLHIPGVVAIPGARNAEQVEANAAAADIDLTEDEWQRLTTVARAVKPANLHKTPRRIGALLLGSR